VAKKTITPAMVRRYLERKGNDCPFCGSDDLEAGTLQSDADYAWRGVTCKACGEIWDENFQMVGMSRPIDLGEGEGP
jgi:transcription elongation factor Elf1